MNMLLFLIISHNPAWWPTYGFDLANTHFSPLKGAMSSAPSITWEYTGAGYVERSPATAEIGDGDLCLETLACIYNLDADPQLECMVSISNGVGTVCLDGLTGATQWTFASAST